MKLYNIIYVLKCITFSNANVLCNRKRVLMYNLYNIQLKEIKLDLNLLLKHHTTST